MRTPERNTIPFAKTLRRRMTDAEVILWSRLRRHPLYRFRRQHPIGPYVADFACPMHRFVVEVDGDTHSTEAEQVHDGHRTKYMSALGWHIFRVTNEDVYKRLDSVLEGIDLFMPPPRPAGAPPP
jgi:very-short-patch-repair endonuclease